MADKAYILNTDIKHSSEVHERMITLGLASACFDPWKYKIERLQTGDLIFLYHSGVGIVAFGTATGRLETSDYPGVDDGRNEVYSMRLAPFTRLEEPLTASRIKEITGVDYRFMQTLFEIPQDNAHRILNAIQKHEQPDKTHQTKRTRSQRVPPEPSVERNILPAEAEVEERLERMILAGQAVGSLHLRMLGRQVNLGTCGRLDLLAEDVETGDMVVIEIKKGVSSDQVVGQIRRYIGWLEQHMAKRGQRVRGIIVALDADDKLRYAVGSLAGVQLLTYRDRGLAFEKVC